MKINDPRDYSEDFSHENGNYQCECIKCNNLFIGHKRRVICKVCLSNAPFEPKSKQEVDKVEGDWQAKQIEELQSEVARLKAIINKNLQQ